MSIDSLEKSLSNLNLNSFQESFHKIFIERIEHFDIMLSIIESKEAFIINLFANEKLYRQLHDNIQNNIYDCKDLVKKITKNRPPTYFDIMNKQKHNKISIFQEFKNLSIECIQSFARTFFQIFWFNYLTNSFHYLRFITQIIVDPSLQEIYTNSQRPNKQDNDDVKNNVFHRGANSCCSLMLSKNSFLTSASWKLPLRTVVCVNELCAMMPRFSQQP